MEVNRTHHPAARAAALATLLLAAACTAAGRSAPGAAPPPSSIRQAWRCIPDAGPAVVPAARALVDVEALSRDLRALEAPPGQVLMSLAYEADGVNVRRDVIGHTVDPVLADSVQKLVFARLAEAPEAAEPWGVRLRIDLSGGVSYATERREYCPPRPRSPELQEAMQQFLTTGPRYRGRERERTVLVRVTVAPAGFVTDASVVRGAASGGTLELRLRDMVRQFSFQPATLDGVAVAGAVTVPLRLRA
ncbi:MAG TPA: TonB family protein [Longimicrobium sp.]|nr:TonB family protein [Longimicrobium sp.]